MYHMRILLCVCGPQQYLFYIRIYYVSSFQHTVGLRQVSITPAWGRFIPKVLSPDRLGSRARPNPLLACDISATHAEHRHCLGDFIQELSQVSLARKKKRQPTIPAPRTPTHPSHPTFTLGALSIGFSPEHENRCLPCSPTYQFSPAIPGQSYPVPMCPPNTSVSENPHNNDV